MALRNAPSPPLSPRGVATPWRVCLSWTTSQLEGAVIGVGRLNPSNHGLSQVGFPLKGTEGRLFEQSLLIPVAETCAGGNINEPGR